MTKTLICVVGRTAAGKSEITKKLAKNLGLKVVQSYKTAEPRPEEIVNGIENADHRFISNEEYDKIPQEEKAAETEINGIRYCTTFDQLQKCDFYVINPNGVKDLQEKCKNKFRIVQFYIYADREKRKARFIKRGQDANAFIKRENSENPQFNIYELDHGYDLIIYNNDNIDEAVETMSSYVKLILKNRLEAIANGECVDELYSKTESDAEAEYVEGDKTKSVLTIAETKDESDNEPDPDICNKTESEAKTSDEADIADETKPNEDSSEEDRDPFSLEDFDFDSDDNSEDNAETHDDKTVPLETSDEENQPDGDDGDDFDLFSVDDIEEDESVENDGAENAETTDPGDEEKDDDPFSLEDWGFEDEADEDDEEENHGAPAIDSIPLKETPNETQPDVNDLHGDDESEADAGESEITSEAVEDSSGATVYVSFKYATMEPPKKDEPEDVIVD